MRIICMFRQTFCTPANRCTPTSDNQWCVFVPSGRHFKAAHVQICVFATSRRLNVVQQFVYSLNSADMVQLPSSTRHLLPVNTVHTWADTQRDVHVPKHVRDHVADMGGVCGLQVGGLLALARLD